jgi:hypothetical protein
LKIIVSDIHGRQHWKTDSEATDIYVLGDYFDSHGEVEYEEQKRNFIELIDTARKDDRYHLLVGNHDLHYLHALERYSGFQTNHCFEINDLLTKAFDLFYVAFEVDGWIVSHAGFTKTWLNGQTLDQVNKRWRSGDTDAFVFSGLDPFGNEVTQGPLWIRPIALVLDMAFPKQIVAHTPKKENTLIEEGDNSLWIVQDGGILTLD